MRHHVKRFIKQCPCCQKMSYLKTAIYTHPYTVACYEPGEQWQMDTIGPLPADENGNRYILVIICCFTRWVGLYGIKDTSAKECIEPVLKHCSDYGVPRVILTDNGTQFVNSIVTELFKMLGTLHMTILSYSHEENAIVERANREVMRHLRGLIFQYNETSQWKALYLPLVSRIMNTHKSSVTGVSPAELLFGNAVNLDRGLILPQSEMNNDHKPLSKHAAEMLEAQRKLTKFAEKMQRRKDAAHMANADPKRTTYANGEYVLVAYPSNAVTLRKAPNKFLPNLKGPMKVMGKTGDRYQLQNLVTEEIEETHITNIFPYFQDGLGYLTPKQVAMRDVLTLFEVQEIMSHRGDLQYRTKIEFLVRWTGYGEEDDLWLPYSELRDNVATHRYLLTINKKNLIPLKFKHLYQNN